MSLAVAMATCSIVLLLRVPFAEGQSTETTSESFMMEEILSENGCGAFAGLVAETAAAGEAFRKQIAGKGLTIFCPDDDAVAAFGLGRFRDLSAHSQVALLLYHGVATLYSEEALDAIMDGELATLADGPGDYNITVFGTSGILSSSLNDANITKMVVHKDRLVVYLIDSVLVPTKQKVRLDWPAALYKNGCGTFADLVAVTPAAGDAFRKQITGDGGGTGLTIFCPDDDAVAAFGLGRFVGLSADSQIALLLYHGVATLYPKEALEAITDGELATLANGPRGVVWRLRWPDYNINVFGATVILSSSLNDANIKKMVVDSDRLVVYLIDSVLVPGEKTLFSDGPVALLALFWIVIGLLAYIVLFGLVLLVRWLKRSCQDRATTARVTPVTPQG